jgi:tetratricopeptide (TPR) repeat protein
MAKGEYEQAAVDYGEMININPKDANAYVYRGDAYRLKRDYEHAIADYDQAIRLNQALARAYTGRALAAVATRDYDRAIADSDQAITLEPNSAAAWTHRGNVYRAKLDDDRAIQDFDQATLLDPKYPNAFDLRASIYMRKGDYDRAIADWTKAIALNSKAPGYYNARASAYSRKGDYARAISDFDKAIELAPRFTLAYVNRGDAYDLKGAYARAIEDYDRALGIDPNHAVARQNRERVQARITVAADQTVAPPPPLVPGGVERRVALVIGNSQYKTVGVLPNTLRDATTVADALRAVGFQSVELATDLDRDGMVRALQSFRDQADQADWALIYYAGHGIEIERQNYVIPTNATLRDQRDVQAEAITSDELLAAVSGSRALHIVMLDACRENPFRARMRRTDATRAVSRGLAPPVEPKAGTLVVFAAKDGEVAADDVDGVNGPFARAFVRNIREPGREVRRVFDYVRDDVMEATGDRQQPFTYGSLPAKRDYFFLAAK